MIGNLRFLLFVGVVVLSNHQALGFAKINFTSENAIEQFHVRNDFKYNKNLRQGGSDIIEAREHILARLVEISTCLPEKIIDFSAQYVANWNIPKESAVRSLGLFRNIFCDYVNCLTSLPSHSNIKCNSRQKYRTINGVCNNLRNPLYGSSEVNLARFNNYLPDYEDGITIPRGVGRDQPLPRPRDISVAMSNTEPSGHSTDSLLLMQWGQFMDHDLVLSPESALVTDEGTIVGIECCEDNELSIPLPKNCMPVDVKNDEFFKFNGVECRRFVRSLAFTDSCQLGPRQQLNLLTSFVDGSQVYGSTPEEEDILRTHVDGRLQTNDESEIGSCKAFNPLCFLPVSPSNALVAGDERAMEQPGLTSMHSVFLRLHNYLAENLKSKYPNRDDEYIFQESRRIVGAVIQNINYDEFLPAVLGNKIMDKYNLRIQPDGLTHYYDPRIDATAFNVFSAAAFRFGHSLIADEFKLPKTTVPLASNFGNMLATLTPNQLPSDFMVGMSAMTAEPQDQILVEALTNKLFAGGPDFLFGNDLYALNIQRGRDHGIPPYNFWRKQCGLPTFNSFYEMKGFLRPDAVEALKKVYNDKVEDVDLFPAALAEFPGKPDDGIVGPTFSCIIGYQFKLMKFGDRFWFEDGSQPVPFTYSQLKAIRKTTLGSLICRFTTATSIQPSAMKISSLPGNSPVPCSTWFEDVVDNILSAW